VHRRVISYEQNNWDRKPLGYALRKVLLVYLAFVDSGELPSYVLRKYVSAKNARLSLEYLSAVLIKKEVESEIID